MRNAQVWSLCRIITDSQLHNVIIVHFRATVLLHHCAPASPRRRNGIFMLPESAAQDTRNHGILANLSALPATGRSSSLSLLEGGFVSRRIALDTVRDYGRIFRESRFTTSGAGKHKDWLGNEMIIVAGGVSGRWCLPRDRAFSAVHCAPLSAFRTVRLLFV